ncbi:MAG TPA: hypothetical protein VGO09_03535 [Flavisolibacter sp.]|nr:hypothetical protein [Flavisolibacter sp.]
MNSIKSYLAIYLVFAIISCKKSETIQNKPYQLSYGDSVFYISNQPQDILASPVNGLPGTFTAFPDGLVIDPASGVINISQSEAGMKYRVTYKGSSGDSSNAFVVVSGINFPDKFYYIQSSDTLAFPVYNADPNKILPSGSFDDDRVANNSGCAMKTTNGQINLTESIRNGLFGSTPKNDTRKDFDVKYRLDDKSGKASNKIKILIYYYDHMSDVPTTLVQTVQDHQAMTFQPNNVPLSLSLVKTAKPRPPCIVIIGHN